MDVNFIVRGLPNLGATCYLNSILQCIVNIPAIKSLAFKDKVKDKDDDIVCKNFDSWVLAHYSKESTRTEHGQALLNFIRSFIQYYETFGSGMQDQHEYLMLLFKIIHDSRNTKCLFTIQGKVTNAFQELQARALDNLRQDGMWISTDSLRDPAGHLESKRGYYSVIFDSFTGQFHLKTQCTNPDCNYISHVFEIFRSWEIDISDSKNLNECISKAVAPIKLEESEVYECDKCKIKTRCLRQMQLWRLPKVLIITLKRFQSRYENGLCVISKSNEHISIPYELDLKECMSFTENAGGKTSYELKSIAHHIGSDKGGHCFSFVKSCDDRWFCIDDENIKTINADQPMGGSTPYLLFYHLKE